MDRRAHLVSLYRLALPELTYQREKPARQAHQFASALLPPELASHRSAIQAAMLADGIGTAAYFSPHVAEQDYFVEHAVSGSLTVTRNVASRIISLPLFDTMDEDQLGQVAHALHRAMAQMPAEPPQTRTPAMHPAHGAGVFAGNAHLPV